MRIESATVGAISKALTAAQKALVAPKKAATATVATKAGGEYSYTYATLADVIESLREPFAANGLSQSQALRVVEGHMELVTTIRHESGEYIRSVYPIAAYDRHQEQGSAITYGRRYSLTALAGITADDDDDGAAAQTATPKARAVAETVTNGDAHAVLDLAASIAEATGQKPGDVIAAFSSFPGTDKATGKPRAVSFTDPRRVTSAKWLATTRQKLEAEHRKLAGSEPGVAAGVAAVFGGAADRKDDQAATDDTFALPLEFGK